MVSPPPLNLSFPESDVAVLTFDAVDRPVNVLSREVLDLLDALLDQLASRTNLAGVVIRSGKTGAFLAGADLQQLAQRVATASPEEVAGASRRGQQLLARFSQLPAVTVAVVEGTCLGGGTELASWCDRRIVADTPATSIGCPEVKLGMIPGWGGTARLPRLIGIAPAAELITTGEPIDALTARRIGWADDLVAADSLMAAAFRMIRQEQASRAYLADRSRRAAPVSLAEAERDFLATMALEQIRQVTRGRQPAPEAALTLILAASQITENEARERESQTLAALWGQPPHRGMFNVFAIRERVRKNAGVSDGGEKIAGERTAGEGDPRGASGGAASSDFRRVGVIGTGLMGAGIAGIALRRDLNVDVCDSRPEALQKGVQQILDEASYDRKLRGPEPARRALLASRLQSSSDISSLASCELIIEAIVEQADAKRALWERLEPLLTTTTVLASNTSTIPISRQAETLRHPERFCGMHFFNPVRRLPLVEVIRGKKTSAATVATAVAFARRIGKSPIVVNDGPGFLVNRMLFPYLNEALQLVSEGVDFEEIEGAALDFGMPVGPLELYDMVGLDTAVNAGRVILQAFPDRVVPSPIIPAMIKRDRLGKKNGKGFFRWPNPTSRREADPTLFPIIDPYRSATNKPMERDAILDRLLIPMLLEATRTLEDAIVNDPRVVDFGVIFGLGFPQFRGGLLFWADSVGLDQLLARCQPLRQLGRRFEPPRLLEELVARGAGYYSLDPRRDARSEAT